jgi:hypothetical protein
MGREDEGVPGLYVNCYPVTFEGDVVLWRMDRNKSEDKRAVQDEIETAVWGDRDGFWATQKPAGRDAVAETIAVDSAGGRLLFAAREAMVDHALAAGREAWHARAGEMHFLGLLESQHADRFVLEPQLNARLVQEPYIEGHAAVVVRARTRWRSHEHLDSDEVARVAVGEPAVRLAGTGPRRGFVDAVGRRELTLRAGGERHSVAPGDYALVTRSRLVLAWRGPEVFRDLQVASGVLTVANKRNRHAVKDRFWMAGRMLRGLGWPIEMPGSARIELGRPIGVQLEDKR